MGALTIDRARDGSLRPVCSHSAPPPLALSCVDVSPSRRCIFEVFTAVHLGARLQALSSARTQSQLRRAHRERRLHRMLPGLWRGVNKGAPLL